jgi:hypothetical protein
MRKWTDHEHTTFISLLEDGASLVSLQNSLPSLRSLSAIATRASAAGYRTQTIDGVKRVFKGINRRTRGAKLTTSEANMRIKVQKADDTTTTPNSDTSATVEFLDENHTESISSSNNKTNKEHPMFSETIKTNVQFRTIQGTGLSADYKVAYNVMDNFEDDLLCNIAKAYSILEEDLDITEKELELFGGISYKFHDEITNFIEEHAKLLHSVYKEDINFYLQIFFNYLIQKTNELNIDKGVNIYLHCLLSRIIRVAPLEWVYTQRIKNYKTVSRLTAISTDEILKDLRFLKRDSA